MCGIAGTYALPDSVDAVPEMLRRIAHRGPDASGLYRSERVPGTGLGNRRLAIIDPREESNQPFIADGLCLVYNGEIYNYRELRKELAAAGVQFRTNSDTEVVARAWQKWGPASLRRLRGMFAFALLDERSGKIVLARDPLGIKPLFFARRGGGLVFASEIKAIHAALGVGEIDYAGVVASLMYYWIPEGRCAFSGIEKLPPGHWAEADPDGAFRIHQYWDPRKELVDEIGPEVSTDELAEIISRSVRSHLIADVPVASFLSGGLDSSLVTALAVEADASIEAYTIAFRPEDQRIEAMPDDAALRPPDGRSARHLAARDRDRPRHRRHAAQDGGDARRAHRRSGGDQHLPHLPGRARGRREGDALGHGCRRALRRISQAPRIAARRQVPAASRPGSAGPDRAGGRSLPVASKRRGYRYTRWAKRFIGFAGLDEAAAFQRSYSLFGRRAAGAHLPGSAAGRGRPHRGSCRHLWEGPGTTRSTVCATRTCGCSSSAST